MIKLIKDLYNSVEDMSLKLEKIINDIDVVVEIMDSISDVIEDNIHHYPDLQKELKTTHEEKE